MAIFHVPAAMIELNPVRQRIADLTGRLDALRGFL
jgi:peptide chain release factor 2